jgi:hypothetical protein
MDDRTWFGRSTGSTKVSERCTGFANGVDNNATGDVKVRQAMSRLRPLRSTQALGSSIDD